MPRKISSHYIFPGKGEPLKRGVIVIDDEGFIIDLIDTKGKLAETEKLEFYDGIITPGFINTHAHLELSHLKNLIPNGTGLVNFIKNIGQLRNSQESDKSMMDADTLMHQNGIVAVGDISNTSRSFPIKAQSKIEYYTFVELFGIQEHIAHAKFEAGIELYNQLKDHQQKGALTPHAPYSMSESLWQLLTLHAIENELPWSVHNQECEDENQLFLSRTGQLVEFLNFISKEFAAWEAKGISSVQYCKRFYTQLPRILLVHNTFTSKDDLNSLLEVQDKVVLVLCPNANLYIENKLPDIELFAESGFSIALGTDSLASNTTLSILEEMKTIQLHFPKIRLNDLIAWGTVNGAKALGFGKLKGSIEIGKKPGLNLISGIDFQEMKLTSQSEVKVLL